MKKKRKEAVKKALELTNQGIDKARKAIKKIRHGKMLEGLPEIKQRDAVLKLNKAIKSTHKYLQDKAFDARWVDDFEKHAHLAEMLERTGDMKYLLKLSNTFQISAVHPDMPEEIKRRYASLQSKSINLICVDNNIKMTPDPDRTQWRASVKNGTARERFCEKFEPVYHDAVEYLDAAEGIPHNHIALVNRFGFAGTGDTAEYVFQKAQVVIVGDEPLFRNP